MSVWQYNKMFQNIIWWQSRIDSNVNELSSISKHSTSKHWIANCHNQIFVTTWVTILYMNETDSTTDHPAAFWWSNLLPGSLLLYLWVCMEKLEVRWSSSPCPDPWIVLFCVLIWTLNQIYSITSIWYQFNLFNKL